MVTLLGKEEFGPQVCSWCPAPAQAERELAHVTLPESEPNFLEEC